MKKLSREELEKELRKEAQGTWILTIVCALIHIVPAFLLNGNGQQMFHMPQWFVVSVFGSGDFVSADCPISEQSLYLFRNLYRRIF